MTMRLKRFESFLHRRMAWLLMLVLLLPLAQTAASWHLLSHVRAEQSAPPDGDYAIHADHCDLCLTAAALTGGAPPVQSVASVAIVVPAEAPGVQSSAVWFTRLPRPYESRAPPFVRF